MHPVCRYRVLHPQPQGKNHSEILKVVKVQQLMHMDVGLENWPLPNKAFRLKTIRQIASDLILNELSLNVLICKWKISQENKLLTL